MSRLSPMMTRWLGTWQGVFTAPSAARQIEARRATWDQFDFEAAVWVKPCVPGRGRPRLPP